MNISLPLEHSLILQFWNTIFGKYNALIYQAYSATDSKLCDPIQSSQFHSLDFTAPPWNHIMVYFPQLGGSVLIKDISLNPKACNGATFRQSIEGWALFQGLAQSGKSSIYSVSSNSEKRALKWESTSIQLGAVSDWNWATHKKICGLMRRTVSKIALTNH
jgi:hypothetical protein